jgi:DNA-binding PadR family transcriptional regulator
MKIPFYLLGLLIRYGPQHGYSLKQIIEETISDFAKIKLPTIYYHLDKLKENGYVAETTGKEGNRPEKIVFTITDKGKKYYDELFIRQLSENYSPEFALDGVLYFTDRVDHDLLLKDLMKKELELAEKIRTLGFHKDHCLKYIDDPGRFSAEAIFEHHRIHLQAELEWLKKTIKGLSR